MPLFGAKQNYDTVIDGLRSLDYRGTLLEEEYEFADYFARRNSLRRISAAAFGQTPVSYETALIGVACSNGVMGRELVNEFRGLGAPIFLEVDAEKVTEWLVSNEKNKHKLVGEYPTNRIQDLFVSRASHWTPANLLRSKNIGDFTWMQQGNLFADLLPELEEHIQEALDPLLKDALSFTKKAYRESSGRDPDPEKLFRLIFLILTAKVFHDRKVNGFRSLSPDDPFKLLEAVGKRYDTDTPQLLTREAREAATSRIWDRMDFRNLSVEVLSQIWSRTLLDFHTKKKLGIYRTSRSIVKYIVDRIPFHHLGDDRRIVFEPCCGSGVFLIGAMNKLRQNLFGHSAQDRHDYFIRHLFGIEKDPFGVEISRLSLTLADFPNPGGWKVTHGDVFVPGAMTDCLQRASVVLCNPPFEDFDKNERASLKYSTNKPVELLNRVLDELHPSGVLGFVLPRNFVDGRGFADIRERIARRFADIELTILPDRAFDADVESALLIAREPIPHESCRVTYQQVEDSADAWDSFVTSHHTTTVSCAQMSVVQANDSLAVPELGEVWDALINHHTLNEIATLARGLEWNELLTIKGKETGNREKFVKDNPAPGFMIGVPPRAKFNAFQVPHLKYLDIRKEHKRTNAYTLPWNKPKVILNKSTRSRGHWRMAAFPDLDGVTCYQTFTAIWPKSNFDVRALAAILNGPVANAFVSTREGKTDNSKEVLELIPMPFLTESQIGEICELVTEYQRVIAMLPGLNVDQSAERLLLEIDAKVLVGYHMPPRVERKVLDYFRDFSRPIAHNFRNYFPEDFDMYFSLSDYLSPDFKNGTAGELLKRLAAG